MSIMVLLVGVAHVRAKAARRRPAAEKKKPDQSRVVKIDARCRLAAARASGQAAKSCEIGFDPLRHFRMVAQHAISQLDVDRMDRGCDGS
jgi:hypothetical protein